MAIRMVLGPNEYIVGLACALVSVKERGSKIFPQDSDIVRIRWNRSDKEH